MFKKLTVPRVSIHCHLWEKKSQREQLSVSNFEWSWWICSQNVYLLIGSALNGPWMCICIYIGLKIVSKPLNFFTVRVWEKNYNLMSTIFKLQSAASARCILQKNWSHDHMSQAEMVVDGCGDFQSWLVVIFWLNEGFIVNQYLTMAHHFEGKTFIYAILTFIWLFSLPVSV